MLNFRTFALKELVEGLRTKKFFALLCVFGIFAMLSPLLARYLQEFLAFLLTETEAEMFAGIIHDPVWQDSYLQLYSNLSQMGVVAIILLYMSAILREKQRGTSDLMFTKGLTCAQFVLAKFMVAAIGIFVVLTVTLAICFGYTIALFGEAGQIIDIILGGLFFFCFLLPILAMTLFFSTTSKNTGISALLSFIGFIVIVALGSLPHLGHLLPGNLLNASMQITLGLGTSEFVVSLIVSVVVTALLLVSSQHILSRQEL